MFAADTNIWIAYFSGEDSAEMRFFHDYVIAGKVVTVPVVVAEFLSDPALGDDIRTNFLSVVCLSTGGGYWQRAGALRAMMFQKGFKPKLPDTLIAQSCIDHSLPLLTRDDGFSMFVEYADLKLVEVKA